MKKLPSNKPVPPPQMLEILLEPSLFFFFIFFSLIDDLEQGRSVRDIRGRQRGFQRGQTADELTRT